MERPGEDNEDPHQICQRTDPDGQWCSCWQRHGPGRGILLLPVGVEYGLAVLAGGLATVCPSYFWAEVLLDTTGETSEIGWLTYPPGGVSATPILNLNPLSLPLPVP